MNELLIAVALICKDPDLDKTRKCMRQYDMCAINGSLAATYMDLVMDFEVPSPAAEKKDALRYCISNFKYFDKAHREQFAHWEKELDAKNAKK